ncbi:MAG: nucleotide exchange factor GrpE [Betaproteobacteria bacterium]|nr:nucleotide exchange factor GrpE [Betaproteobacteria bacterium]
MSEQHDTFNLSQQTPPAGNGRTSESAPNDAAAPDGAEVMPSMEELLRKAELQATEHYDAWLRAKAEADNVRKRAQEDVAKAHKFAIDGFSSELLAVKDSLEAALDANNTSIENMRNGVEITLRQLVSVFDKFSIKEIDPAGQKFDPHFHQAMSMMDSDQPPNTVVQVFQKGYLLHDRVLRPALVAVSKSKDA